MELDEFIKNVIVSIHKGLDSAKTEVGKSILPSGGLISDGIPYVKSGIGPSSKATMVSNLEFEVALTDSNKDGVKSGIGVLLGSLNLGVKGSNETEQISLSKIKFNIPINLE